MTRSFGARLDRLAGAKTLGHSIFTEGKNLDEIRAAVQDAIRCHFENKNIPRMIRLHIDKKPSTFAIVALGCAGAVVYVGVCRLLSVREIAYVMELVRGRLRRQR